MDFQSRLRCRRYSEDYRGPKDGVWGCLTDPIGVRGKCHKRTGHQCVLRSDSGGQGTLLGRRGLAFQPGTEFGFWNHQAAPEVEADGISETVRAVPTDTKVSSEILNTDKQRNVVPGCRPIQRCTTSFWMVVGRALGDPGRSGSPQVVIIDQLRTPVNGFRTRSCEYKLLRRTLGTGAARLYHGCFHPGAGSETEKGRYWPF